MRIVLIISGSLIFLCAALSGLYILSVVNTIIEHPRYVFEILFSAAKVMVNLVTVLLVWSGIKLFESFVQILKRNRTAELKIPGMFLFFMGGLMLLIGLLGYIIIDDLPMLLYTLFFGSSFLVYALTVKRYFIAKSTEQVL